MSADPTLLAFLPNIGGMEWVIIGIIALLLFGRRLPDIMKGLGTGMRQFKKGLDGHYDDESKKVEGPSAPPPSLPSPPPANPGPKDPEKP